ncbi:hypothetical protein BC937DRAFT_94942 [Endogone sp. FLAS-F59071]|nr:hypothetical protein BC937DRAFT_94942 [Endogone sp. FLAS-F59071]|eukprot:RUS13686.1 hypothetical protein BC937DRAFT_94942 [Endogone sp. FLAS-F59071]
MSTEPVKRWTRLSVAAQACSTCNKPSSSSLTLLRCTRCKRSVYCSPQCARTHFPHHKKLCRALATLLPLYAEEGPCEGNFGEWKRRVLERLQLVTANLGQPLEYADQNMVLFEPKCQICFVTELTLELAIPQDDARPSKLIVCPQCRIISCCSDAHWEIYRPRHDAICDKYLLSVTCDNLLFKHNDIRWMQQDYVPLEGPGSYPPLPSGGWPAYFSWRQAPPELSTPEAMPFRALLTDRLSQCLTILSALQLVYPPSTLRELRNLTIHFAGGSQHEIIGSWATEEIQHCLPALQSLHIVLVDPTLDPDPILNIPLTTCPTCTDLSRTRTISTHGQTYHAFASTTYYTRPDLVVGFNSGLHEVDINLWRPTLRHLVDLDVPCVFTSYNEQEAKGDVAAWREFGARVVHGPERNGWASEVPLAEPMGVDEFYVNSGWWFVVQGRE